jgi:phosphoenolpyruvate carboxykinase (GTP)
VIAPEWEDPKGVPISAILFGGRRASAVPLVTEAFDWQHGVFLASNVASEGTAAAENRIGELRRDPFAMLPFCGYHMGDYFDHWLKMGAGADAAKLPRIYFVNWFRKDAEGRFLWPGFGENSRVLEWVFRRCAGDAEAHETAIGLVPAPGDLYTGGLDVPAEDLEEVLAVDPDALREQLPQIKEHLSQFGDQLPAELKAQLDALERRLGA